MKSLLTEQERSMLDQRVAEAEQQTGAQIVLACVARSDAYAELPWKAFALGAAIGGMGVVASELLRPAWTTSLALLLAVASTLLIGAALALATVLVPAIGRVFLDRHRAETETRQYAESLFLSRELFATSRRSGVLLLVSMFERKMVLLVDRGLRDRLPAEAREKIIASCTPALAGNRPGLAFDQGLSALVQVLGPGHADRAGNELPNGVIEGEGA